MVMSRHCAARWVLPVGSLVLLLAAVVGCQSRQVAEHSHAHHSDRFSDRPAVVPPGVILDCPADPIDGLRAPQNVLALSSGGLYGAYTTGVLDGWSRTGTRPEFDVVTGASTGALIAPFAFLGSDYDAKATKLYTTVKADDIYRIRSWVTIPFRESLATSTPLRNLIQDQIDHPLMEKIAAEHRKGRRLYVATTDLRTRRAVIWDMGAIASLPCPQGCTLFRDVLLASASIPAVLPSVGFQFETNGRCETRRHVDGGATAPLFMPPGVFTTAAALTGPGRKPMPGGPNFYAIAAGKLYPDEGPVRRRILPVLGAATSALLSAHCLSALENMYWQSRFSGMHYHMIALRQDADISVENTVSFNVEVMQKLYLEGLKDGGAGPAWTFIPPTLAPCFGEAVPPVPLPLAMPRIPTASP